MNAVLIWIFLPLLFSLLLFLLQTWFKATTWVGTVFTILIAVSIRIIPVDSAFRLGPWTIQIASSFPVFGRQIIIEPADQPMLVLIYSMAAFWMLGSTALKKYHQLTALTLSSAALIIFALSIQPIYYAAILFEFAALVLVLLLSSPDRAPSPGVLRFLIFQTLGMLLILFSGWLLGWINTQVVDLVLLPRALLLMGLGLAFLLGIFPFTTWITMLAEGKHPYLNAVVFSIFINGVFLFVYDFLDIYQWIREYINIAIPFQVVGILMIGLGGIWVVFQNHLGRMMGAAVITEIGRGVLILGFDDYNHEIFFTLVVIQVITIGIWSFCLTLISNQSQSLELEDMQGVLHSAPFLSAGTLLAHFSMAGIPLLASFPLYWLIESELSTQFGLWTGVWFLSGSVGLLAAGLRTLSVMALPSRDEQPVQDGSWFQKSLIAVGGVGLLVIGLFSNNILRGVINFLAQFP